MISIPFVENSVLLIFAPLIMAFAATWVQLEILILSEANQKEKDKYHMISLLSGISYMAQTNLSAEKK